MPKTYSTFYVDKDGIISFRGNLSYYWFPDTQLTHHTQHDGFDLFNHLLTKSWFSDTMFWELLDYVRSRFPEINFDKAIYDFGQRRFQQSIFKDAEWWIMRLNHSIELDKKIIR